VIFRVTLAVLVMVFVVVAAVVLVAAFG